jgi:hypothetical protein
VGLVVRQPDAKTEMVLGALARDGVRLLDQARDECWLVNLRAMGQAIAAGTLVGGVVLTAWPAAALMVANKVRGVRAVAADRPETVGVAMRQAAPNMLVVDPSTATFHELRSAVRLFVSGVGASAAPPDKALAAMLRELEKA